eukprot:gene24432-29532_t
MSEVPNNLVDLNTVDLNSLPNTSPSSKPTTTMSSFVQDEINSIINILIKVDSLDPKQGLTNHASPLLLENTHVLCKGREYENLMSRLLRESKGSERNEQLERVHALVSGFVQAERKNRARQKMNYVLAGATSGRIDQAIQMLVETEEIDDDLLIFIDYLVEKEQARSRGGTYSPLYPPSPSSSSSAPSSATLDVLLMVQRRLRAETVTSKEDFVRILHILLSLPPSLSPAERVTKIRELLKSIEQMRHFEDFVQSGVDFIKKNGMRAKEPGRKGSKTTKRIIDDSDQLDGESGMAEDISVREVELSPIVLEQMKDLLIDIRSITKTLYTGGVGDTVFEMQSTRKVPTKE